MNKQKIKFITRTGLLLSIALIIQLFGSSIFGFMGPSKIFAIGSLINLCLIVATGIAGLASGLIISVLTPFVAAFTTHSAASTFILTFAPFIALGNAILVVCYYMISKWNKYVSVSIGAFLKFVFLFLTSNLVLGLIELPAPIVKIMSFSFSYPQIITALIGGFLGLIIVNNIKDKI